MDFSMKHIDLLHMIANQVLISCKPLSIISMVKYLSKLKCIFAAM